MAIDWKTDPHVDPKVRRKLETSLSGELVFEKPPQLSDPETLASVGEFWRREYRATLFANRAFGVLVLGMAAMFSYMAQNEGSSFLQSLGPAALPVLPYTLFLALARKTFNREKAYSDWKGRAAFNVALVPLTLVRARKGRRHWTYFYRWQTPSGQTSRCPSQIVPGRKDGYIAIDPMDPSETYLIGFPKE